MKTNEQPIWLTLEDFARELGVSKSTARRIMDRGEVTYVIVGGRPRVRPEHVDEYLQRQTREAVA